MSKSKETPIYIQSSSGNFELICKLNKKADFSTYLHFPNKKFSIHIHPTGHINFRGSIQESVFLHDPLLFDGTQPIAIVNFDFGNAANNDSLNDFEEPANFLSISNNTDAQIIILISRYPFIAADRPTYTITIPDLYSLIFLEKPIGLSRSNFMDTADPNIEITKFNLGATEIDEPARYKQSKFLRAKGNLMRDPVFQSITMVEKAREMAKLHSHGIALPFDKKGIELIFPQPMRVGPKIIAKGDSIYVRPLQDDKPRLNGVRAVFEIRDSKNNQHVTEASGIEYIEFDAEL